MIDLNKIFSRPESEVVPAIKILEARLEKRMSVAREIDRLSRGLPFSYCLEEAIDEVCTELRAAKVALPDVMTREDMRKYLNRYSWLNMSFPHLDVDELDVAEDSRLVEGCDYVQ